MTELPKVGAPATRAVTVAGYQLLESLAGTNERTLLDLHGCGPQAVRIINEAPSAAGLSLLTARDD